MSNVPCRMSNSVVKGPNDQITQSLPHMTSLKVLMVAAEAFPFAKVGGLGDVMGALPRALEKLGVSVTVAIPRYRVIDLQQFGFEPYPVPPGSAYDVHRGTMPG